jgi:hypothetical protein
MIGHNVRVRLSAPDETVQGELRELASEGVWIYHGFAEQAETAVLPDAPHHTD